MTFAVANASPFQNMSQLSQVLEFGDPSRLYAGGIEVWNVAIPPIRPRRLHAGGTQV